MENNQPIIIKRVKRFGGGHHGGAWKIAFADFATAMMAFFLVLWLMSTATPEQKIAIADYGRVASRAFSEVESALSAAFAADERERILGSAVASNARAVELAQTRLRVGSGDQRAVLQQSVALYAARTSLVKVQAERLVQRVNLNLALGGSFDPRPTPPASGDASPQTSATAQ